MKDATTSYAGLFDLFESFAICLTPLDIYTKYPPTRAVTKAVQEIILELLRTLALATNQVKQGQLSECVPVDPSLGSTQRREIPGEAFTRY